MFIIKDSNNIKYEKRFSDYIKNFDLDDLMYIINETYKEIKGFSNLIPDKGVNGSIEFASTLLLWKYANAYYFKNQKKYLNFLILLGVEIGLAFNYMPALECSCRLDKLIELFPDIITEEEWHESYIFLKNNLAKEIRECEFNRKIDFFESYNNRDHYKNVMQILSESNYNSVYMLNYFSEQSLQITNLLNNIIKQ